MISEKVLLLSFETGNHGDEDPFDGLGGNP